jgi:ATP-dependent Clp protease ATP-binding subunit ClpC
MKKMIPKVRTIFKQSFKISNRLGETKIIPEHIILAIFEDELNHVVTTLSEMGSDSGHLSSIIEGYLLQSVGNPPLKPKIIPFNELSKQVVSRAEMESDKMGDEIIGVEHIFLAILKNESLVGTRILGNQGITYKTFKQTLTQIKEETMSMTDGFDEMEDNDFQKSKKNKTNKSKTPILDNFGKDITKMAEDGGIDPIIGRDAEVERVAQILSRRKKNNPILIGEPGVGKTAIVEGLALKIVTRKCPRILYDMRVVSLDLGSLVAGTKYRGQFEERMKGIMTELVGVDDVILFIDEIHTMVGAGNASGSMDASNLLKPALARGDIRCIGATTLDEFRENIEKDGALTRRFQNVIVEPPSTKDTLNILNNIKDKYENHHKVTYTDEAVEACVTLSDRYITDRQQPDKSIDIMDEVGARAQVKAKPPQIILDLEQQIIDLGVKKRDVVKSQQYEEAAKLRDEERHLEETLITETDKWNSNSDLSRKVITDDDVAKVVAMTTGIPVTKVGTDDIAKLINMGNDLKCSVIGQDDAITQVTKAIKRTRVGVKRHDKPTGSFIFLGPTGVGKTHLAKMLAEHVYGTADALIRVDMSEYMEKHTVSKLVGAPPGYVGYEEGGQLTEKVRRKPYSVILLDEIEKAHPDVFNILLQLLDDGHLTDSLGRKIDFRNTMVIMTSNVGARKLQDFGTGVGFGTKNKIEAHDVLTNDVIQESLKKAFSPEFLNRLDDIIVFNSLTKDDIKKLVEIPVKQLIERVGELGYNVKVTPKLKEHLVEVGYDEKYGARPLNRAIQKFVEDPIAERLLEGGVDVGDTLKIGFVKDDVTVEVIKPKSK